MGKSLFFQKTETVSWDLAINEWRPNKVSIFNTFSLSMVVLKSTETEVIATWSLSENRTKTSYVSHSLCMYSKKLWGSIILSVCRQLMEKTCFQTEDNIDRLNLSSKIAYLFGYCISTALHFTKYHICVYFAIQMMWAKATTYLLRILTQSFFGEKSTAIVTLIHTTTFFRGCFINFV